MSGLVNEFGQPVGQIVGDWQAPPTPRRETITGSYCMLVPLAAQAHALPLHEAFSQDRSGAHWTYLPYGPFASAGEFRAWVAEQSEKADPLFFAVVDAATACAGGIVSYMRMAPDAGSIEIGHIHFASRLQGTRVATEALYLMLKTIFSLGYRRCEWKCNALNEASRAAAIRLGFSFEGVFRQAAIVKGRNRDTAWYSILDREWPELAGAFEAWLAPDNFSADGVQRRRLSELTARANASGS